MSIDGIRIEHGSSVIDYDPFKPEDNDEIKETFKKIGDTCIRVSGEFGSVEVHVTYDPPTIHTISQSETTISVSEESLNNRSAEVNDAHIELLQIARELGYTALRKGITKNGLALVDKKIATHSKMSASR